MGLCSIMSIPNGDCIIISHPCSIYSFFYIIIDVKEEICFGEDLTEVTKFTSVVVNVTRDSLGCNFASFSLNLSYNIGNVSVGKYMQSWLHLAYSVQLKHNSVLFFL